MDWGLQWRFKTVIIKKKIFFKLPEFSKLEYKYLAEEKYHRLWVGSTLGQYMIDPKTNKMTRFLANLNNPFDPATIANNEVDRIIIDDNNLWITYSTGLFSSLNTTDLKFKHYT